VAVNYMNFPFITPTITHSLSSTQALFKSCSLSTAHFNIMMTYINDPAHLILSMMTLGEKNHNLQLAVFSVLKMFIANPKKSAEVG
jgi:hypothetical protein